ncbi:MAG TPA: hypothetical protein VJT84_09365 [Gaiellaceae bacterium]|nr:hypothetical protein [Gaiellaceae bacterium]
MAAWRGLAAVAATALCVPAGAASASPAGADECEAFGPQTVCVGALPTSQSKVVLKGWKGSGEQGLAVVSFGFHETKVVITLRGAPAGVAQPVQIRRGGCFGPTVVRLGTIVNGRHSVKVGPLPHVAGYSIVVHASSAPGAALVACGVIPPHTKTR